MQQLKIWNYQVKERAFPGTKIIKIGVISSQCLIFSLVRFLDLFYDSSFVFPQSLIINRSIF